ncbi:response regulator [Corynebacterium variabile]|uniref:Two component transcriptional regulator, LuxR family n=3 Tax=Corynebacterium variabile TaxID=1727 RepID=A0A0X2NMN6_9CORY|nr:response regulator transcription factor [Corynebacterium variabile]MDN6661021.1 response regulator transcription factor [Corynebacterium variabile]MDN6843910.1 response regulator transcription factor [Corynebacterium variabile]CUU66726.1 two component transcriptional regulator, LuxR family [Corynebacterium variabile]
MITVVVVDDEALVASSLSTLLGLEEDLDVLATLGSGEELLDWWDAGHAADVVVMDLQLGGIDGVETARRLGERTTGTTAAVLIVTSHGRPRQLRQALAAGVPGFIRKTSTAAEFAAGVRTVHAGRRYLDPDLAAAAIGAGESPLTEREAEVLEAAGRGGSVEQIAAQVHLASGTTRNYLSAAMGKTGASTRFEAWRIARERDWL